MPDRYSLEVEANSDRVIARRLTMAYVCGLLLIGFLTAGVHILLDHVIMEQRDSATIINVAGRQRMLSQRIALLSSAIRAGDASAREPLLQAIALMERSQDALVHGGDLGIVHQLSPTLHAHYFAGPDPLDPAVRAYLAAARKHAETGEATAFAAVQNAARAPLLQALDQAVQMFETEANGHIDSLRLVQKSLLVILLIALVLEATFIFRPLVKKVGQTAAALLDLATHDTLTGFFNRRFFMENARQTIEATRRAHAGALSVLMLDLDHFKRVNDTWGHAAGDAALARFADTIRAHVRSSDLVARLGGEEFAILLPRATADQAMRIAEKLRHAVANTPATPDVPAITVSIGVSSLGGATDTLDRLLDRADKALYRAKANGRNCVQAAQRDEPDPLPASYHPVTRHGGSAAGPEHT